MVYRRTPSDKKNSAHRQMNVDAVRAAERNVVAALAFNLAYIDQYQVDPNWFDDPQLKTVLKFVLAYHRYYPAESSVTSSRLVQFAIQNETLRQLLCDGDIPQHPASVTDSQMTSDLEIGWHSSKSIAADIQVLKDATFRRERRRQLAKLDGSRSEPKVFLGEFKRTYDSLEATLGKSSEEDVDPSLLPVEDDDHWPNPLIEDALMGVVGEFVRIVLPQTESGMEALLFHFLAYFAAEAGRNRYCVVESTQHYPQLYVTFVGASSKGRKGTAQRNVERIFSLTESANPNFIEQHVTNGLSSGEGLIYAVRDPIYKGDEIVDDGISDKRLLIVESEFASVLKSMRRDTNTLSAVVRDAWDTGRLRTLVKNSPVRATEAHINFVGHTTREELRRLLTDIDQANGFANRFLWVCSKRSRLLPDGGNFPDEALANVVCLLRRAIQHALQPGRIDRTPAASQLWREVYPTLAADRPGMLGMVTNRAEAQVLRLSLVFALLDCADAIDVVHLKAALACWRYCEESARYAFGCRLGDSLAEQILALLKQSLDGVSRTRIRDEFTRNKNSSDIQRALGVLLRLKLAHFCKDHSRPGRPAEIWYAGPDAKNDENAETKRPR